MSDMNFSISGGWPDFVTAALKSGIPRVFPSPAAGARNVPVVQGLWLLEQQGTATPECQNSPMELFSYLNKSLATREMSNIKDETSNL